MKSPAVKISPKNDLDSFVGILCPIKWDGYGNPCGFSVYNSYDEVVLKNHEKIKNISGLIGKKVKAFGQFYYNEKDDPIMNVKFLKKCNVPHPRAFDLWNNEEFEVYIPKAG